MSTAQIFVVGMHRSGTSAITNLLANMGAFFGAEEESIGFNQENPKGFWERRDVRHVNDFILHSMSCEWDCLAHWDLEALTEDVLVEARKRIREIYARLSVAGKSFVIKDPRLCLLLPIWTDQVQNPVVVYAHRNPLEIAKSLESRNNFDKRFSLHLWEFYSSRALSFVKDVPTLYINFQSVIDNEMEEAARLKNFLRNNGAEDIDIADASKIRGTIEDTLKNQNSGEGIEEFASDYQYELSKSLKRRCQGKSGNIDLQLKPFELTDREENVKNLERYSVTKLKYDELQDYRVVLKKRIAEAQQKINSYRHMEKFLVVLSESKLLKILYPAAKKLRFIKFVNKGLLAYEECLRAYNKTN